MLLAAGLFQAGKTPQIKDWPDGPVRYISQQPEVKAFRALSSDDERALFIERFWARRDPSPQTLANEYRQLFWERVHQANSMFVDSSKPGWLTDRGKIYILYGPPTEIEEEPNLDTESGSTAGRGLIRWIYQGRPGERLDLNPITVVPFVRDVAGEYRVSYDPKLASVFFDALAVREQRVRKMDSYLELLGSPGRSTLSVMLDLGRMQEVPPQEQILLERVETVESYRTEPVRAGITCYQHADRGGTVVVVTADVSHEPEGVEPAVFARFTPHEAARSPRVLGEESFRSIERDGFKLVQGRLVLDPGTYDLTLLLANPDTARTGMYRRTFTVADPVHVLRFSDLVWAREVEPVTYASLSSHDEPYQVGPFRVLPKLDGEFRRGETIRLFYEIYGGEPPYRVSYQLEGQDADGSWLPLGQPSVAEQQEVAQAWELPTTASWPLGAYRVRIEVQDAKNGLISTQFPFMLQAEAS